MKYLLIFIITSIIYYPISGYPTVIGILLAPYYTLWFLLSIFYWYVLTQIILKLPHPLVISFIIAILIGYTDKIGPILSLSRSLSFLPFFLIGFFYT